MQGRVTYETGVLGAILKDSSLLPGISEIISPADFERLDYQEVYQVAIDLQGEGQIVDPMLISGEMKRRGIHTIY